MGSKNMTTEQHYVEKGEHSTHDQLVVTEEREVEELLEAVDRNGRDAVKSYLDDVIETDTVMVQGYAEHTDFQGSRAVTIDYWALDGTPNIAV